MFGSLFFYAGPAYSHFMSLYARCIESANFHLFRTLAFTSVLIILLSSPSIVHKGAPP
ncbi:hypothetical protein BDZ91DRAFT_712723 [Kalaharituber pfeilii]|nr:hypothetical protein BDZ91DRAFT_712723 [Kalaharituber pfeilii]